MLSLGESEWEPDEVGGAQGQLHLLSIQGSCDVLGRFRGEGRGEVR